MRLLKEHLIKSIHYENKEMCNFEIDKITYSKRIAEQRITLTKIRFQCILNFLF